MTTFEIVIVCLLAVAFLLIINLHYTISKMLDILLDSQNYNLDMHLKCISILRGLIK